MVFLAPETAGGGPAGFLRVLQRVCSEGQPLRGCRRHDRTCGDKTGERDDSFCEYRFCSRFFYIVKFRRVAHAVFIDLLIRKDGSLGDDPGDFARRIFFSHVTY